MAASVSWEHTADATADETKDRNASPPTAALAFGPSPIGGFWEEAPGDRAPLQQNWVAVSKSEAASTNADDGPTISPEERAAILEEEKQARKAARKAALFGGLHTMMEVGYVPPELVDDDGDSIAESMQSPNWYSAIDEYGNECAAPPATST